MFAMTLSLALITGCTGDDDFDDEDFDEFDDEDFDEFDEFDDDDFDDFDDDDFDAEEFDEVGSDVGCSSSELGTDDTVEFLVAAPVIDGELMANCFGGDDARLDDAWDALATIVPPRQLGDLGLFGGFESVEDGDEVTLASVNTLGVNATLFQMSVNLDEFAADPDEAQLTMAHEFAHVFTQLDSQLDRTVESQDNCTTYDNGDGCFFDDSIMWQWIEEFWGEFIDDFDALVQPTGAEGQERCDLDAGFFGAYGASNPEEDFAEAFSAYVFGIEISAAQQPRIDWIDAQPGLRESRDRAVAAGIVPPPNNFDECGLG